MSAGEIETRWLRPRGLLMDAGAFPPGAAYRWECATCQHSLDVDAQLDPAEIRAIVEAHQHPSEEK